MWPRSSRTMTTKARRGRAIGLLERKTKLDRRGRGQGERGHGRERERKEVSKNRTL